MKILFREKALPIRISLLREQAVASLDKVIDANYRDNEGTIEAVLYLEDDSTSTQQDWNVVVDAHDGTEVTDSDKIQLQVIEAEEKSSALFSGLQDLDLDDAMYAAWGRAYAEFQGASQAEIDAIVNRATAGAYLTGTSDWTNLTAAEKQWAIASIEAMLRILRAIYRIAV